MFCVHCGSSMREGASFCPNCGSPKGDSATHVTNRPQYVDGRMPRRTTGSTYAPGKNYLKVTGILLIVFSAIAFMLPIGLLSTIDEWLWFYGGEAMRGAWQFRYTAIIFLALYGIFMGIMGIAYCTNTEKANILLKMGGTYIAAIIGIPLIGVAMGLPAFGDLGGFEVLLLLLDFVLPILFIVGASKNNDRHQPQSSSTGYSTGYWRCSICDDENPSSSRICKGCGKDR